MRWSVFNLMTGEFCTEQYFSTREEAASFLRSLQELEVLASESSKKTKDRGWFECVVANREETLLEAYKKHQT
jgi:DNA mismatch repair ATPase MutS